MSQSDAFGGKQRFIPQALLRRFKSSQSPGIAEA
jgi:hypothetical protein